MNDDVHVETGTEPEDEKPELSKEEFFQRNLDALAKIDGYLYQRMKDYKSLSKLVYDEDGDCNVEYENFSVYAKGARAHAEDQIKAFTAHSSRLTMSAIGKGEGLDPHTRDVHEKFANRFDDSGFRFTHAPFRDNCFFAIVLGVGLGLHLKGIVEKTKCRKLILFEPNLDLVYHSLHVCDWADLVDRIDGGGASIEIFSQSDTETLSYNLKALFRQFNPSSLDGTLVFQHYHSAIFQELTKTMSENLRTAVMGLGFYQDEINMISQSYKNLERGNSRVVQLIDKDPGIPAFVIASGPSLEKLLPFIKENQDKAILFCCGTAVDILMANDIVPDFWVMMERIKAIYTDIKETHEIYDLSEIRFAGSTTIFPKVPEIFKESIFFFRPGLSPAPLFAQNQGQIAQVPDPLAANAGLSFAMHVGFREVYFLGVDVGSPFKDRGHAKGSVYERRDGEPIKNLDLPVPGNFGGTAWTTPVLQWSKENLEKLISFRRGRVFYNLGTGALIKGATPIHPKAVKLSDLSAPKVDLLESFVESCPVYSEADFEDAWEKGAIIDRLPEFCENLKKILRDEDDFENFGYLQETMKVLKPAAVEDPVAMLLRGTVFTAFTAFEFYANRAVDDEERRTMFDIFREEYDDMLDHLRDRAIEVFTGLEDGDPWDDEFVA